MQPLRLTIPGVHQTKGRHADMLTAFQGQMVVCSRLPASDTLLSTAPLQTWLQCAQQMLYSARLVIARTAWLHCDSL